VNRLAPEPEQDTRPPEGILIIGCGALARELESVVRANQFDHVTVDYLPARLHNTPDRIPPLVDERIAAAKGRYQSIFVAYGDCGTGGLLDGVLARHGVDRLPGAHCYEFFSGGALFHQLHEEEPGTFYLTDYLTRHFDRLVWRGLGLDRHPSLREVYFANYRRLVYLSQSRDESLVTEASQAAEMLGLSFEHRHVGLGLLEGSVTAVSQRREVA
jgi:hypothetical protein